MHGLLAGAVLATTVLAHSAHAETGDCTGLAALRVEAAAITLPTGGAEVISATPVEDANGPYCRVAGAVLPVDPAAPRILFQADLPQRWNGRALQFGGGGYNGRVPNTTGHETHGLEGTPTPLARGYLTFASDSGHQSQSAQPSDDASFALNAEALRNFAYQHVRKTLDAVRQVAIARYGEPPRRVYLTGGSTGGREGLTAAARWPEAYDGVVAWYPTASYMGLRLWGAHLARAVYDDDSAGWIPPAMVDSVAAQAVARCDGLDGVADGLVSDIEACRAGSAAFLDGLRCRNGETGHPEHCLTRAQVERTIRVYHEGYALPYSLANDRDGYLGLNSLEGVTMFLGSQPAYADPLRSGPNARHAALAYEFFKYFVNGGRAPDMRRLDVLSPGPVRDRVQEVSALVDATATDLERFAARGGKLILLHGHEDQGVSPRETRRTFQAIEARMGRDRADRFIRYFEVPGLAHGAGRFSPTWESLAALDAWVENRTPPENAVITDGTKSETRGRTRPLCRFPTWPKYRGGDPNLAASFACATE